MMFLCLKSEVIENYGSSKSLFFNAWVGPTPKSNETVLKAEVDAFGVYNWLKTKVIRK